MKSIKRTLLTLTLIIIFLFANSSNVFAWPRVTFAFGKPNSHIVYAKPGPNYVWVEGHYKLNKFGKLVWVPGHWKKV